MTENDCEDQGYSRIEDGCLRWECQTWERGATKPTHPKLEKRERYGRLYWTCPKCGGSYGDAGPAPNDFIQRVSAAKRSLSAGITGYG